MFPTGNNTQDDIATVTLSVPVKHDGDANDFILDALVSQLNYLTNPTAWNDTSYSVSATDAAAYAQTMFDSMSIVWP